MNNFYILLVAYFISFTINAQIIDIPDAEFKNTLVNTACCSINGDPNTAQPADTNDDGEISVAEALETRKMGLGSNNGIPVTISSLDGLEYFVNLVSFGLRNSDLTSIDLTNFSNLERIDLFNNTSLSSFNINGLANLHWFAFESSNAITELDLSTNQGLTYVSIWNSDLDNITFSSTNIISTLSFRESTIPNLDLSNLTELFSIVTIDSQLNGLDLSAQSIIKKIWCSNSQLTELDLSSNPLLEELWCSNNQLTELDLSSNPLLRQLDCNDNLLTSLDISNTIVYNLKCENNQLESLNIKNGVYNRTYCEFECDVNLDFNNNPNLIYVCADDEDFNGNYEISVVQNKINDYGYTNCHVNSYCSFVLGGEYYTIEGNVNIDLDANGCDTNDAVFPNLNFTSTDGVETGNFISNTTGDYSIPVGDGIHTITPNLENPNYFTINPSSFTVDFPTDASPYIQDFCVTPNGEHYDLEITIIPLAAARPGFDTDYKLIYKNKGTSTLSGDIIFGFQDEVMEFVSSTPPNESGLTDLLSWSFSDLTPFESREIDVTMNLNSPMDANPLNGGDNLTFITSISSSETDETPDNNTFELHQTVVNSFDPNDKTCLEGDFITPEMVGDYVHYMIRFENTGTADAINIVVKDDIDVSKYDLSSLVPLHASHDYIARIKDNTTEHYVEFIFENINLPFDDANNDGYIVFKIKTLDTLALNDTFENDAEIYFDFNFPIITNNESTTVGTLSTEDFEFANNTISLYPNPTTHTLYLESEQPIKQIAIYDISGRRIKEIAFTGSKTDVNISTESLTSGTYFVKIKTIQGETVRKIIKD